MIDFLTMNVRNVNDIDTTASNLQEAIMSSYIDNFSIQTGDLKREVLLGRTWIWKENGQVGKIL